MAFTASFAAVLLVVVACTVACSANSVGFEGVNLGKPVLEAPALQLETAFLA